MADYAISNVDRRIVYTGSAGVGPYAFNFEVLDQTDIAVYKNTTLLVLTTNYTVSINPSTGVGSVTLNVAATSSDTITIVGARAIQRTTDFTTGGDLFANSLNDELDSLTIFSQQVAETAERGIKAPVTDPTNINMTLPAKADRIDSLLQFDLNGNPGVISTADLVSGLSGAILGANYVTTNATGDGSTTAFTVSSAPGDKGNIQIYLDGVYQNKNTFSISGTTVTFTEAPPVGSAIEFVVGYSLGSTSGADAVTYTPAGVGAQTTTVQTKLRETVSVKDFGAVGDGVTDDTAAFLAADTSGTTSLIIPGGTYKLTGPLSFSNIRHITPIGPVTLSFTGLGATDDALTLPVSFGESRVIVDAGITIDMNGSGRDGLKVAGQHWRITVSIFNTGRDAVNLNPRLDGTSNSNIENGYLDLEADTIGRNGLTFDLSGGVGFINLGEYHIEIRKAGFIDATGTEIRYLCGDVVGGAKVGNSNFYGNIDLRQTAGRTYPYGVMVEKTGAGTPCPVEHQNYYNLTIENTSGTIPSSYAFYVDAGMSGYASRWSVFKCLKPGMSDEFGGSPITDIFHVDYVGNITLSYAGAAITLSGADAMLGLGKARAYKLDLYEQDVTGTNRALINIATASGGGISLECSDLAAANPRWSFKTNSSEYLNLGATTGRLAFYDGTGGIKQTISGSKGGNAALADLLTKLATLGLITDGTT